MAVKRHFFPNAPSLGLDEFDRAQLAIFYPFPGQNQIGLLIKYIRRYLNDVVSQEANVALSFTPASPINNSIGNSREVTKQSLTTYLRRMLNDLV